MATVYPAIDERDVMDRALRAYFRAGGPYTDQPAGSSDVRKHNGQYYAVLENCRGPLAVFRVQKNGSVRRLQKWPKQVEV